MELNIQLIIKVCIILLGTALAMKISDLIFKRVLKNKGLNAKFIHSCTKAIIVIAGLSTVGMQFTVTAEISKALVQSTSLLVAVAGFAAQSVLSDVISGVMISWQKPFDVGDRVVLKNSGITGLVEDITIRHTVIKTFYNSRLIVPNSVINKEILENSDYNNNYIGNLMEIGISYSSNLDKAIKIFEDTIRNNKLTIDIRTDKSVGKDVNVQVKELAESSVILKAVIWTKNTDDSFAACSEIRHDIKLAFDKEGIEIPYNQLDVHVREQ